MTSELFTTDIIPIPTSKVKIVQLIELFSPSVNNYDEVIYDEVIYDEVIGVEGERYHNGRRK